MREHVYTLIFSNGHRETVKATTPSEAVRSWVRRTRSAFLPHTITDETAMAEWISRGFRRQQARGLTGMR